MSNGDTAPEQGGTEAATEEALQALGAIPPANQPSKRPSSPAAGAPNQQREEIPGQKRAEASDKLKRSDRPAPSEHQEEPQITNNVVIANKLIDRLAVEQREIDEYALKKGEQVSDLSTIDRAIYQSAIHLKEALANRTITREDLPLLWNIMRRQIEMASARTDIDNKNKKANLKELYELSEAIEKDYFGKVISRPNRWFNTESLIPTLQSEQDVTFALTFNQTYDKRRRDNPNESESDSRYYAWNQEIAYQAEARIKEWQREDKPKEALVGKIEEQITEKNKDEAKAAETRRIAAQANLTTATEEASNLRAELADKKSALRQAKIDKPDLEQKAEDAKQNYDSREKTLTPRIETLVKNIATYQKEIDELKERKKKLPSDGKKVTRLGNDATNKEKLKAEISTENSITNNEKLKAEAEKALFDFESEKETLSRAQSKADGDLKRANTIIEELEGKKSTNPQVEGEITKLQRNLTTAEATERTKKEELEKERKVKKSKDIKALEMCKEIPNNHSEMFDRLYTQSDSTRHTLANIGDKASEAGQVKGAETLREIFWGLNYYNFEDPDIQKIARQIISNDRIVKAIKQALKRDQNEEMSIEGALPLLKSQPLAVGDVLRIMAHEVMEEAARGELKLGESPDAGNATQPNSPGPIEPQQPANGGPAPQTRTGTTAPATGQEPAEADSQTETSIPAFEGEITEEEIQIMKSLAKEDPLSHTAIDYISANRNISLLLPILPDISSAEQVQRVHEQIEKDQRKQETTSNTLNEDIAIAKKEVSQAKAELEKTDEYKNLQKADDELRKAQVELYRHIPDTETFEIRQKRIEETNKVFTEADQKYKEAKMKSDNSPEGKNYIAATEKLNKATEARQKLLNNAEQIIDFTLTMEELSLDPIAFVEKVQKIHQAQTPELQKLGIVTNDELLLILNLLTNNPSLQKAIKSQNADNNKYRDRLPASYAEANHAKEVLEQTPEVFRYNMAREARDNMLNEPELNPQEAEENLKVAQETYDKITAKIFKKPGSSQKAKSELDQATIYRDTIQERIKQQQEINKEFEESRLAYGTLMSQGNKFLNTISLAQIIPIETVQAAYSNSTTEGLTNRADEKKEEELQALKKKIGGLVVKP